MLQRLRDLCEQAPQQFQPAYLHSKTPHRSRTNRERTRHPHDQKTNNNCWLSSRSPAMVLYQRKPIKT